VIVSETLGAIRERAQGFGGQITPFQAAMVAIAATVGTGHFTGMIAAVLTGGPGAVFWMWLGYLLGMATKFAEATLAVHFRRLYTDGSVSGGP
ncbi:alanine:cation symporter family protein, partial [Klebsiella pneumoniae]|nr:alanine:cation symporter family protein [Klebsiella pneumoniae]